MGEVLAFSQSALLLLPQFSRYSSRQGHLLSNRNQSSLAVTSPLCFISMKPIMFPTSQAEQKGHSWITLAGLVSDSTVDLAAEGIDILPDSGGSDGNFGGDEGGNGGEGGGNGSNHDKNDKGSGGSDDQSGGHEKKVGMSMSQKLTLGYAALVGIGGAMGYLKGGSKKSLMAGGLSASILYYVYSLLPSNPVLASSVGLVLSASLLGVMGSRFKKSGKIFPAGVVSLASFVMSGGYLHGILRSLH